MSKSRGQLSERLPIGSSEGDGIPIADTIPASAMVVAHCGLRFYATFLSGAR